MQWSPMSWHLTGTSLRHSRHFVFLLRPLSCLDCLVTLCYSSKVHRVQCQRYSKEQRTGDVVVPDLQVEPEEQQDERNRNPDCAVPDLSCAVIGLCRSVGLAGQVRHVPMQRLQVLDLRSPHLTDGIGLSHVSIRISFIGETRDGFPFPFPVALARRCWRRTIRSVLERFYPPFEGLRRNPAFARTRRFMASTERASVRRAAQLTC